jgi:hypothetical protein
MPDIGAHVVVVACAVGPVIISTCIAGKGGTVAKFILLEELHLEISVPREQPEKATRLAYKTFNEGRFLTALRRHVRAHFQRYPALQRVRVKITR